jgi:phospholipid/cholesterol/gamma-HCH transport system substrate-binding protein
MIGRRVLLNVGTFLALSAFLVYAGATNLVLTKGGGRTLSIDFVDAAGVGPRDDVTMRGVPVGAVTSVALTPGGLAQVHVLLQPGILVPAGAKVGITRRSPIGDLVVEITPGRGAALPTGAHIPVGDTTPPPDPELTIQALAHVLHAVPSQNLGSLVSELAVALRGRGRDLGTLSRASADLPSRILEVQAQLRSLIENGPNVTGVLADNAAALKSDIAETAALADILRDRRYDLVKLSHNGAAFAQVANGILAKEKPNISCLVSDFGAVNSTLAQPDNLRNLVAALQLNHYFFDGVWQAVQRGNDGLDWFRVDLLLPQQPAGREHQPHRAPPGVYPGNGCSSRFGRGVGPVTQPGPVWLANGSKIYRGAWVRG